MGKQAKAIKQGRMVHIGMRFWFLGDVMDFEILVQAPLNQQDQDFFYLA